MNINSYHDLITFLEPLSWEQQLYNKKESSRNQQPWKNLVSHSWGCQIKLTCASQYWYTVTLGASEAKLLSPTIFSCKHLSVRMASVSSEADIETDWTIGRHQTEAWGATSRNKGRKKNLNLQYNTALLKPYHFHFPCVCCLAVNGFEKEWLVVKIGSELTFSHFYQQLPKVIWHNSWWIQAQWISFAIFNLQRPPNPTVIKASPIVACHKHQGNLTSPQEKKWECCAASQPQIRRTGRHGIIVKGVWLTLEMPIVIKRLWRAIK